MSMTELFEREPEQFITIKHAADLVQKSISTIRRWIDEGKISAIKVGGTWLVHRGSLKHMIVDPSALK